MKYEKNLKDNLGVIKYEYTERYINRKLENLNSKKK